MFYISFAKPEKNTYGVTDTVDGVTEYYTEEALRSCGEEILGVYKDCIIEAFPPKLLLKEVWLNNFGVIKTAPLNIKFFLYNRKAVRLSNALGELSRLYFERRGIDSYNLEVGKGGETFTNIPYNDLMRKVRDWFFQYKICDFPRWRIEE